MAFHWKHLFTDPLPDFAFEVSESGIAWTRPSVRGRPEFVPFRSEVLSISPLHDNVRDVEEFGNTVRSITGASTRRRRCVLILPDFCARVAVLDFDAFPTTPEEQLSLVRFRMKKSVPFDVESALVRYHAQAVKGGTGHVNVVVVVAAMEIVARYEAPFRSAGLHAGFITTSSLAAMDLEPNTGVSLLAKLSGRVLSAAVVQDGGLKLLRTLELAAVNAEEIADVLHPTMAYAEDELGTRPARLLTCGFDGQITPALEADLGVPGQALKSRWGVAGQVDAGLLGYLEALK